MKNLLLNKIDWEALHSTKDAAGAALLDAAGDPTAEEPRIPGVPEPLAAANPNHSAVAAFTRAMMIADSALTRSEMFKKFIVDSLGEQIAQDIADPLTGHLDIPHYVIVDQVNTDYGILDADDVLFFEEEIVRWEQDEAFTANISRMHQNFLALAPLGTFDSDLSKIKALRTATKSNDIITTLIFKYMDDVPLIADQTFDAIVAHIKKLLPNATARARHQAVAMQAQANAAIAAADAIELAEFRAQKAANLASAAAAAANPPKQQQKAQEGGRKSKAAAGPRLYCHRHGYPSQYNTDPHGGRTCKTKQREGLAQKFLDATSPTTIDGVAGSRRNE
jgi:hypothetical protein